MTAGMRDWSPTGVSCGHSRKRSAGGRGRRGDGGVVVHRGAHARRSGDGTARGSRGHRPIVHVRGHRSGARVERLGPGVLRLPAGIADTGSGRRRAEPVVSDAAICPAYVYGLPPDIDALTAVAIDTGSRCISTRPGARGRVPGQEGGWLRHLRGVLAEPDESGHRDRGRRDLHQRPAVVGAASFDARLRQGSRRGGRTWSTWACPPG